MKPICHRIPAMKHVLAAIGAIALVIVLVIGLRQAGDDEDGAGQAPTVTSAFDAEQAEQRLAGAPAPLAGLHRQRAGLLRGGRSAFRERVRELRGYPVVVNKWASWCGPCRLEFPEFQRASVALGKRVAFLGINSGDSRSDAAGFLADFPVPYPSYEDPDETIARSLRAAKNYPVTIFLDRRGEVSYVHMGPYRTQEDLQADVRRYAL